MAALVGPSCIACSYLICHRRLHLQSNFREKTWTGCRGGPSTVVAHSAACAGACVADGMLLPEGSKEAIWLVHERLGIVKFLQYALLQGHDSVRVHNGVETVGNGEHGAVL